MKKITAQSLCVTLLFSFLAILVLGQLSPVEAKNTSSQENLFSWFLSLVNSSDRSQIFLVDEDNGSTIEAHVGQTITIMLNYPRVDTEEEKTWSVNDKAAAWKTNFPPEYFTAIVADKDQKHVAFCLNKDNCPENNQNRLTDADLNIASNFDGTYCYPRLACYRTLQAKKVTEEGTTQSITLCCYKNNNIIKKVWIHFKIVPATTPSKPDQPTQSPKEDPNAPETADAD
ncbi:MAG: hypothetical protein ACOYK6_04335 [Chthoniobacterales bacterium]